MKLEAYVDEIEKERDALKGERNKGKIQLHPHTRLYVEAMMEQERRKQR